MPRHVATYNTFNWDIKTAFAVVGPLVDEVMAEKGVFHDVLDSLKNDPQGPKVNIAKDLVGNLGNRGDGHHRLSTADRPEERAAAGGHRDDQRSECVADTIAKTMKGDAAPPRVRGACDLGDRRRRMSTCRT